MRVSAVVGVAFAAGVLGAGAHAQATEAVAAVEAKSDTEAVPSVDPKVSGAFDEFCASWMGKLAQRESDNVRQISWRENDLGVEGDYVGYSQEHTCDLKAPGGAVPIGKVNYREFLYRKKGESIPSAESSDPQVLEITEVTEIFRYNRGKWIY